MKSVLIALLFVAGALSQGYIRSEHRPSVVKTELPKIPKAQLPANYSWANVDGINYLTLVRNQHIPVYCGSCWAFATTSALSDRIKIARNAQWPDIDLAPQVIISCDGLDQGCDGGDPINAYSYIYNYSVTDETCTNYQARGITNGLECTDFIKCGTCDPDGTCSVPESYLIYDISEFGEISGESDMMNELFQRGPISCVVDATYLINYTSGIVNYPGNFSVDHAVSVVGWGTLPNGTTYWTVRNSWGSYWGEYGFFNIIRGNDTLGIESSCVWAVPSDTWTNGTRNTSSSSAQPKDLGGIVHKVRNALNKYLTVFADDLEPRSHPICYKPDPNRDRSYEPATAPWAHVNADDLPVNYTWQNVNGTNYLSWSKNQHIPQYCGSCWAQAATSVIADRINIARNNTNITVAISPQAIINCGAGGDCDGGESMGVYEYAKSAGVVEDSCQNYVAANPAVENCSPIEICKTCIPPAPPVGKDTDVNCSAVTRHPTWKVSSYGSVRGAAEMKKAIFTGGPISCGMDVTNEFENYSGGIYKQFVLIPMLNHEVSVVGWGTTQAGESYWIVRNSWGTFWGEWGFFQIKMGGENLGIETQCSWAIPIVE